MPCAAATAFATSINRRSRKFLVTRARPPCTSAHSARFGPAYSLSRKNGEASKFHSRIRTNSGRSPKDSRRNRETVISRFRPFSRTPSEANLNTRCSRVLGFSPIHTSLDPERSSNLVSCHCSLPGTQSPDLKPSSGPAAAATVLQKTGTASLYPTRGTVTTAGCSSSPMAFRNFETAVASDPSTTMTSGQTDSSNSSLVTTSPACNKSCRRISSGFDSSSTAFPLARNSRRNSSNS